MRPLYICVEKCEFRLKVICQVNHHHTVSFLKHNHTLGYPGEGPTRHPTRKAIIRDLVVQTANVTSAGTLATALKADQFSESDIILVQEHHLRVPIYLDGWRHTINKTRMD